MGEMEFATDYAMYKFGEPDEINDRLFNCDLIYAADVREEDLNSVEKTEALMKIAEYSQLGFGEYVVDCVEWNYQQSVIAHFNPQTQTNKRNFIRKHVRDEFKDKVTTENYLDFLYRTGRTTYVIKGELLSPKSEYYASYLNTKATHRRYEAEKAFKAGEYDLNKRYDVIIINEVKK